MIALEGGAKLGQLDKKLFVSLRPFQSSPGASWRDPVDIAVAHLVSDEEARRGHFLPFQRIGEHVFIAVVDPEAPAALELTEFVDGKIILCRAEEEDIMLAQDRVFGLLAGVREQRMGAWLIASGRVTAEELAAALAIAHRRNTLTAA